MKTILTLVLLAAPAFADNSQLRQDLQRSRTATERTITTVGVLSRSQGLGERRETRDTSPAATRDARDSQRLQLTQDPHGNPRLRPEIQ